MRCAIFLEKTTRQGDILIADTHGGECSWASGGYYARVPSDRKCVGTAADTCFLTPGTYTVTAQAPQGKTLTVRAYTYEDGRPQERFPADGSAGAAPLTFTLTADRSMIFDFGFGDDWDDDSITTANTKDVRVHDTSGVTNAVTETVAIMPDEIADSDSIAEEINAKKALTAVIPAGCEAFGFAEQTITYVRVLDLDLIQNGMIFKGRVTGVSDVMSETGFMQQEITCASALDFLDDTNFFGETESKTLGSWLIDRQAQHNAQVEPARQCFFTCDMMAQVEISDEKYCTDWKILHEVLTGGKYLTQDGNPRTAEYKERWQNDVTYIDVAERFGAEKTTPFKIGENLGSIRIEQTAENGIYSAVTAVSGINSNGKRESRTLYNVEMWQKYGGGRTLILRNDDIRCTAPCEQWNYQASIYEPTAAYLAMVAALLAYARQEADKLSRVPIRITLTAADLAAMGFTGYERFEIGNLHPLVLPEYGYYGQPVRITGIKRRLTDGKIGQIVIESGEAPGKKSKGSTLTAMMARLTELNEQIGESETKLTEIAETKAEEQTGGLSFLELTQAQFDEIAAKDSSTVYYVDDSGDIKLYKGDYHISTGGGGGDEPYIETACVLTSGQQTEWAPDHELLPVEFRGSAGVWYGQPPARFVLQGQRAIHGLSESADVTEDDIMSEVLFTFRDGTVQKIKVFAYAYSSQTNAITLGVVCYQISGGVESVVGQAWNANYYWTVPSGTAAIKAGFAIRVTGFYINPSGDLAPTYTIRMHAFADGTQATPSSSGARQLPGISGMLFPVSTGSNVDFGSAAERGFASGIAVTSEPVWPNGGE